MKKKNKHPESLYITVMFQNTKDKQNILKSSRGGNTWLPNSKITLDWHQMPQSQHRILRKITKPQNKAFSEIGQCEKCILHLPFLESFWMFLFQQNGEAHLKKRTIFPEQGQGGGGPEERKFQAETVLLWKMAKRQFCSMSNRAFGPG